MHRTVPRRRTMQSDVIHVAEGPAGSAQSQNCRISSGRARVGHAECSQVRREYTIPDLDDLLRSIPQNPPDTSFGADLDEANKVLLDVSMPDEKKKHYFRQWASRHQPCMFGRLGARNHHGIAYDICWVD